MGGDIENRWEVGGGRCGWEDMEDVAEELTILIRCEEE